MVVVLFRERLIKGISSMILNISFVMIGKCLKSHSMKVYVVELTGLNQCLILDL